MGEEYGSNDHVERLADMVQERDMEIARLQTELKLVQDALGYADFRYQQLKSDYERLEQPPK